MRTSSDACCNFIHNIVMDNQTRTNSLGRLYAKGKPVQKDTRLNIVKMYSEGCSYGEISQKTGLTKMGCFKIVNKFITTGSVDKTDKRKPPPTKMTDEVLRFIEYQKIKQPSIYCREIREKLITENVCTRENVPSVQLINGTINKTLGMTRKILQSIPAETRTETYDQKLNNFLSAALQYSPEKIHFFDEAPIIRTDGNRKYGHSFSGEPAIEVQRYASNCTLTVNLCCGYFGIGHCNILDGPSNAMEMINFVDELLGETNDMGNPILMNGDCFILDNCGFHHQRFGERLLRNMLARGGIQLLFQPPYSPELNVCEYGFRLMRDRLRENTRMTYEFTELSVVNSLTCIPDSVFPPLFRKCVFL